MLVALSVLLIILLSFAMLSAPALLASHSLQQLRSMGVSVGYESRPVRLKARTRNRTGVRTRYTNRALNAVYATLGTGSAGRADRAGETAEEAFRRVA